MTWHRLVGAPALERQWASAAAALHRGDGDGVYAALLPFDPGLGVLVLLRLRLMSLVGAYHCGRVIAARHGHPDRPPPAGVFYCPSLAWPAAATVGDVAAARAAAAAASGDLDFAADVVAAHLADPDGYGLPVNLLRLYLDLATDRSGKDHT